MLKSLLAFAALLTATSVSLGAPSVQDRIDQAHTEATTSVLSQPVQVAGGRSSVFEELVVSPAEAQEAPSTDSDVVPVPEPVEQKVEELPESTKVVWAWGEWVEQLGATVMTVIGVMILWAIRMLPESMQNILRTLQFEQIIKRAQDYGTNVIVGASKDKKFEFNVGNEVLAASLTYFLKYAPAKIVKWSGGPQAIAEKLWARFDVVPSAGTPNFAAIAHQAEQNAKSA